LVASCETSGGGTQLATSSAGDGSTEQVIQQTYRLIGERHLYTPDFRRLSVGTYNGFASADPELSLQTDGRTYTVMRDGRQIFSRSAPSSTTDSQAWGNLMADLFAASVSASPALQQAGHSVLTKDAMLATTKQLDRNTRYSDPDEARDNRFQRDGGGGIGITVERTEDAKIVIRAVQDGSPASKRGVMAGDQIVAIDGESMLGRPLIDVVHKLRGLVSAPVSLTLMRPAEGRELTLSMQRDRIIPTTVTYERDGNLALIHVTGFNTGTTDMMITALNRARSEIGAALAGIIIDMRGNRGGLLDQAESMAELFVGDGVIFSTEGRHPDSQRVYRSDSHSRAIDLPIVILVNGNSASAAEIVTAALQDRGRAVVVGTTSYGKGTVQTVIRLSDQGELVLTWSRLLAPSGYTWNELGIMPNVCTAKVADIDNLGPATFDANRSLLRQWHAERDPSPQQVSSLRAICPPSDETPNSDVTIADKLLHNPTLYAYAMRAGAVVNQATAP